MNQSAKELLNLLQTVRKHSKKEAMALMRELSPAGQNSLLHELRRYALETQGQASLPLAQGSAPKTVAKASVKAKKVPYTVLLPPTMLELLKELSELDGAPVSHHIRIAIKAYLDRRR